MGESQTQYFYDFGILGRVPEPQNQLLLSLETPKIKQNPGHFKQYYFYKSQNFGNLKQYKLSKRWAPKNPDDPSNKILKILDMRSIAIKDMK